MRFFGCFLFLVFLAGSGAFARENNTSAFMEQAALIAASMDDNVLAAQVLLTGIDGRGSLPPAMRSLLQRIPAGGVMLFRYNLNSPKEDVKRLLSETSSLIAARAGIPPFISADHEGGLVHRFGPGVQRLPSAFSFWELAEREGRDAALARAETLYRRSAQEIRDLGINMVLAPVAETLNEDNRIFLETRSYGPDPGFTEAAASVFIANMDAAGIASVVKHFPGNTAIDPHYEISSLMADRDALDEMVKPFAGIIQNLDPPSIMLSHVMVPALDSQRNASLSRAVIQDWLRDELGFQGIIMADDYSMGAVSALGLNHRAATVAALNAGVDMIMVWPHQLSAVHAAILEALRDGRLSQERLLDAASRIIAVKLRYGIGE
jgi:beta-N-acetylhexosaminidase